MYPRMAMRSVGSTPFSDGVGLRSKCFDLCFCASAATASYMPHAPALNPNLADSAAAVAAAFSFKMFNQTRHGRGRPEDHLLLFYSFNLSVLH